MPSAQQKSDFSHSAKAIAAGDLLLVSAPSVIIGVSIRAVSVHTVSVCGICSVIAGCSGAASTWNGIMVNTMQTDNKTPMINLAFRITVSCPIVQINFLRKPLHKSVNLRINP